jgi:hypothetical protein
MNTLRKYQGRGRYGERNGYLYIETIDDTANFVRAIPNGGRKWQRRYTLKTRPGRHFPLDEAFPDAAGHAAKPSGDQL